MPGPGARFSEGQGTQTDKGLSPEKLPESRGRRSTIMEEIKPASPVTGAD